MTQIDASFDTWKRLTSHLIDEKDSYDRVIARLLNFYESNKINLESLNDGENDLDKSILKVTEKVAGRSGDWVVKNVLFPEGTEFRGEHEGAFYYAKVQNGALYYDGERFESPSSAAMKVRNYSENGWRFWECKRPSDKLWIRIGNLRRYGKGL